MERDILVCPLWQRPEFLRVWIEVITRSEMADQLFYIFCLDHGYDTRHLKILKEDFPFDYGIIKMPKSSYKLGKQSFNVLNGMLSAAHKSGRLVFYVEEDIFPGKDFFKLHYEIHKQQSDIFCSIGTRCNNSPWITDGYLQHYYLSNRPDYQSWGSCFKKEVILKYIMPHFNEDYFKDPNGYCARNFAGSVVGNRFTEQDGLIRRIVEKTDLKIAYPHVARAYHAGFYGYNRKGKGRHLSYDEKVELVRQVAFNPDMMKEHSVNEGYYKDSKPIDLDTDFTILELVNTTLA